MKVRLSSTEANEVMSVAKRAAETWDFWHGDKSLQERTKHAEYADRVRGPHKPDDLEAIAGVWALQGFDNEVLLMSRQEYIQRVIDFLMEDLMQERRLRGLVSEGAVELPAHIQAKLKKLM